MSNDAEDADPTPPRQPRLQFSLKAVLVVVTLVSLWLGYWQIQKLRRLERYRRATELARQMQFIETAVKANLATPPLDTTIVAPKGLSADWFLVSNDQQRSNLDSSAGLLFAGKPTNSVVKLDLTLDARKALDVTTVWGLRKRLLRHYQSGLAEHGLSRIIGRDGVTDPQADELWSVWMAKTQNQNVTVYIRVRLDDDATQASAQILMTAQASLP
jgi:hypothetical protein